jgi:quercetin dioxygenase-like cupin family protein
MIGIMPAHSFTHGNAQLNVYYASEGQGLPRHEHTFNHISMCCAGKCIVRKEGKELIMTKETQPINLVANEWHEVEALEDGTVFVNIFTVETT